MSKSELSPTHDSSSKQTMNIKQPTNILKSKKPRSKIFGVTIRSPRKPPGTFKPIRNMTDCSERLEVRGAADGNIWKWCSHVLKINKKSVRPEDNENNEGLLILGNSNFPCPMMSHNLNIPASPPVEPTYRVLVKTEAGNSQYEELELEARETEGRKRFSPWSKDFSSLYPVYKVSSLVLNQHRNN